MTPEQRAKNIRVETEIMNVSLKAETDAEIQQAEERFRFFLREHSLSSEQWDAELAAYVARWRKEPRDFCGDLNLCVNVMQPRLEELSEPGRNLTWSFEWQVRTDGKPSAWQLLNLSAEARVDAALRALDSMKAGGA